jgi:hypothetical protein
MRNGGPEYEALKSSMMTYLANINGSTGYLYQRRVELETIIEERGAPTLWFSFSMADNHWHDLHRVLCPTEKVFATEEDAAAFRRKVVRENPHVVEEFFHRRVKALLHTFFGKDGFEADWHWIRYELQKRGAFHIHGCARLKHAPEMTDLGKKVYEGRVAERILKTNGVPLVDCFPVTQYDVWATDVPEFEDLEEEKIEDLQRIVSEGITAEQQIALMHEMLLSTMHPDPPSDARSIARNFESDFDPSKGLPHPSSFDPSDAATASFDGQLLNAVQRHKHNVYY